MSLFERRAENVVDERRNRQPTYLTGLMVSTRDVVQESLKNPWFLSTRQMAPIYGDKSALISDWNKDGISVVGPDYERPESRKPWTYVGVLIPGIQGSDSGKTEGFSVDAFSTKSVHNYAHMVASRKETPTGLRVEQRRVPTVLDTNTEQTTQDVDRNTPPTSQPKDSDTSFIGPKIPTINTTTTTQNGVTRTHTTVSQPLSTLPLNKAATDLTDQGLHVQTKTTNTGSLGSRIQTGTTLIPSSTLGARLGMFGRGIR